jgi:hypothetical protein
MANGLFGENMAPVVRHVEADCNSGKEKLTFLTNTEIIRLRLVK